MTDVKDFLNKISAQIKSSDLKTFSQTYSKLAEIKNSIKDEEERKLFTIALKQLLTQDCTSLFPNDIPKSAFGVPSSFSDAYVNIADSLNSTDITLNNVTRTTIGSSESLSVEIDSRYKLSIKLDEEIIELDNGIEGIFEALKKCVSDGSILQHYCALWNYSTNIQKSFRFNYVKIDDILSTFLKIPEDGYFRTGTRQNFTKSIRFLEKIKLRAPVRVRTSGKESKSVQYINFPLLDFSLSTENKDGTVILTFIGSMLGGSEFNKRGRIFPQGIFKLDARSESNRISLAFRLATRFDQLNQKPISYEKQLLLKHAGLCQTNSSNNRQAVIRLKETLDRLIDVNCISKYIWNDEQVVIYSYLHDDIEKLKVLPI